MLPPDTPAAPEAVGVTYQAPVRVSRWVLVSFLLAAAVLLTGLTYTHPSALFASLALTAPRGLSTLHPQGPEWRPSRKFVGDTMTPMKDLLTSKRGATALPLARPQGPEELTFVYHNTGQVSVLRPPRNLYQLFRDLVARGQQWSAWATAAVGAVTVLAAVAAVRLVGRTCASGRPSRQETKPIRVRRHSDGYTFQYRVREEVAVAPSAVSDQSLPSQKLKSHQLLETITNSSSPLPNSVPSFRQAVPPAVEEARRSPRATANAVARAEARAVGGEAKAEAKALAVADTKADTVAEAVAESVAEARAAEAPMDVRAEATELEAPQSLLQEGFTSVPTEAVGGAEPIQATAVPLEAVRLQLIQEREALADRQAEIVVVREEQRRVANEAARVAAEALAVEGLSRQLGKERQELEQRQRAVTALRQQQAREAAAQAARRQAEAERRALELELAQRLRDTQRENQAAQEALEVLRLRLLHDREELADRQAEIVVVRAEQQQADVYAARLAAEALATEKLFRRLAAERKELEQRQLAVFALRQEQDRQTALAAQRLVEERQEAERRQRAEAERRALELEFVQRQAELQIQMLRERLQGEREVYVMRQVAIDAIRAEQVAEERATELEDRLLAAELRALQAQHAAAESHAEELSQPAPVHTAALSEESEAHLAVAEAAWRAETEVLRARLAGDRHALDHRQHDIDRELDAAVLRGPQPVRTVRLGDSFVFVYDGQETRPSEPEYVAIEIPPLHAVQNAMEHPQFAGDVTRESAPVGEKQLMTIAMMAGSVDPDPEDPLAARPSGSE